jgi:hypothetical protein
MSYRPYVAVSCIFALTLVACGVADMEEGGSGSSFGDDSGSSRAGTGTGSGAGGGSLGGGSSAGGSVSRGGSGGTAILDPGAAGAGGTAGASSTGGAAGAPGPGIQPGTLTAGAWDDNRNYDFFSEYRAIMGMNQPAGLLPFTDAEHDEANAAFADQLSSRETLDVALVIDTTGSMGDEMLYLRTEFLALSAAINESYPNAAQRWALVVYRDVGDLYVVRSFDFTENLQAFQSTLAQQTADGGGDMPEAPDQALAATAALDWRSDAATARLAFWIADAPHHTQNARAMVNAVRAVRDTGVHLYPVASSGIDELSEHSMRSAAQLTGGRYLFLTDDSGVGGSHKEPTIPCYFVTRLDDAILRMVEIELSGEYHEPTTAQIIRTGGNPESGRCTLTSGDIVFAY